MSPQELRELQRLMAKAKAVAAGSLSAEKFVLIPAEEMPGAMTDGSKRREMDTAEIGPGKKMMTSYAGPGSSGAVPHAVPLGSLDVVNLPMPSTSEKPPQSTAVAVELPPDVPDVQTWGRTIVSFGKHANRKLTYAQFMSSTDSDLIGYRKWCYDRRNTCSDIMHDFTNYMQYCEQQNAEVGILQAPLIPGTNTVRRLG